MLPVQPNPPRTSSLRVVMLGVCALEGGGGQARGGHVELVSVRSDALENPGQVLLDVDPVVFRRRDDSEQDRGAVCTLGAASKEPAQARLGDRLEFALRTGAVTLTRSSPPALTRSSPPPDRDPGDRRGLGPRPTRSARSPCPVFGCHPWSPRQSGRKTPRTRTGSYSCRVGCHPRRRQRREQVGALAGVVVSRWGS